VTQKALPILAVLVAVTGLWLLSNRLMDDHKPQQSETPATLSDPPAAKATKPTAATGRVVPEKQNQPKDATGSRKLELPDGTFVATLNGAIDAPPLARYWGPFDWSPILGVERNDAGLDWYKHADGSYSTTQMVWRSDLGRNEAMTRVAHPGPAPATTAAVK
jgi:hypothetical protein